MKKLFIIALSLICIVFGCAAIAACGSNVKPVTDGTALNENIMYKLYFTDEDECPNGNIKNNHLHDSIDIQFNKIYYMVVDFTVSSFNAEGWGENFNATVKISPTNAIQSKLEEASTGTFSEEDEGLSKKITTVYKIPENRNKDHSYRFIIQINLLTECDWATAELAFYGDGEQVKDSDYSEELIICRATQNLNYELDKDGTSYNVTGCDNKNLISLVIPETYENLPVSTIGTAAFSNFDLLNSVYISDSVTTIFDYAFESCDKLESVKIGNGLKEIEGIRIFSDCVSLKSLKFGNSLTALGFATFKGCVSFESIVIPDSVTDLDGSLFEDCSSLKNVELGAEISGIGYDSFAGCTSLASIELPDSLIGIGESAFAGCSALESLVIPDSVTIMDKSAFSGCGSLKNVMIGNGLTQISDHVFYACDSLESIVIPDNISYIRSYAFGSCDNLGQITVPDKALYIERNAFDDTAFYNDDGNWQNGVLYLGNHLIEAKSDITGAYSIKSGTRSIACFAFSLCGGLTELTIPESVLLICNNAFKNCALESVVFENTRGWKVFTAGTSHLVDGAVNVSSPQNAAGALVSYYSENDWRSY